TARSAESTARLNSCGGALRGHGRPRRPRRNDFTSLVTSTAMPPSPTLDTDVLLLTLLFSLLDKQTHRAGRAARSGEQSFPMLNDSRCDPRRADSSLDEGESGACAVDIHHQ